MKDMILVTGATGHIGNVLVKKLLAQGRRVRILTLPADDLTPMEGLDVEIVEGDIRRPDLILPAFEGVDLVFHLAGIVSIMPGDELLYQVNVEGTRNVVAACLKTGVKRLVYTSSVHALKEAPHGKVIDESCGYHPESSRGGYDCSKALASLEVLEGVEKGLDAVIVCPSGVIGPCDYNISQMGQLFINYMQGKLKAYVDGAYDFVDVRDVAQGLILASRKGETGESYVLSGEKITVRDLLLLLGEITGVKPPSLKIPLWLVKAAGRLAPLYYRGKNTRPLFTTYSADVLTSNCDISSIKAREELGYSARPLRESIENSIAWFRENPWIYVD
jgi:dihydroflavonol-4-reductase